MQEISNVSTSASSWVPQTPKFGLTRLLEFIPFDQSLNRPDGINPRWDEVMTFVPFTVISIPLQSSTPYPCCCAVPKFAFCHYTGLKGEIIYFTVLRNAAKWGSHEYF